MYTLKNTMEDKYQVAFYIESTLYTLHLSDKNSSEKNDINYEDFKINSR